MNTPKLKLIKKKEDLKKTDSCDGYLIDADEKMARRIVDSLKGKKKVIAMQGRDDIFNRRAIETLKIDYLIMPEAEPKKDSLKQRDSGLNHVVAKEAARKNISIAIDLDFIKGLSQEKQSKILSRTIQNIKICRRAKCNIRLFSKETDKKGASSFLTSLGMSSQEVKKAINF